MSNLTKFLAESVLYSEPWAIKRKIRLMEVKLCQIIFSFSYVVGVYLPKASGCRTKMHLGCSRFRLRDFRQIDCCEDAIHTGPFSSPVPCSCTGVSSVWRICKQAISDFIKVFRIAYASGGSLWRKHEYKSKHVEFLQRRFTLLFVRRDALQRKTVEYHLSKTNLFSPRK